jgi:predicted amidohydrolase
VKIWLCILLLAASARAADLSWPAARLRVAVVQMAQATSLRANRDRIVQHIAEAAVGGARVAVFPENALMGQGEKDPAQVESAVEAVRLAARRHALYVLFGGRSWFAPRKRLISWLHVIGPDGRDLLRYDKLFDRPRTPMPGVFHIDGVPCSAYLCADRWLRGVQEIPVQEGAQITFELSCNYANEWVPQFGWYWNVPQAVRNNVWVVFANTGNTVSGVADSGVPEDLRHGHSAVIAPDGRVIAASRNDVATILFAEIDANKATRAEARAGASQPALHGFWEDGVRLYSGETVEAPALAHAKFSSASVTLAASLVTGDAASMAVRIREARAKGADLIAFPARAIAESALPSLKAAARTNQITVVFGAEFQDAQGLRNSAFAIGKRRRNAAVTRSW